MHDHKHHQSNKRIGIAFVLNLSFTIVEFIGGLLTNSTAILADAVHDLGDTLSIGLGWLLDRMSHKGISVSFSYGYHRLSLLSAVLNSTVLIIASLWVLTEAIPRLFAPQMPDAMGMTGLALLGVAVNGYAAYKLSGGKTLNEKVLNWHLLEDTLGWVAILIVSIILLFVEWPILDPILSVAFTSYIFLNVIRRLIEAIRLFMQAVPDEQSANDITQKLKALDHVANVHNLHIWSLDGERNVLTVHLLLDTILSNTVQNEVKQAVRATLAEYDFADTTIELEQSCEPCRDQSRNDH